MASNVRAEAGSIFEHWIEAMSDKHGQIDVRFDHLSLRIPMMHEEFELSGTITVQFHMRDLDDAERQAHVSRNLAQLGAGGSST